MSLKIFINGYSNNMLNCVRHLHNTYNINYLVWISHNSLDKSKIAMTFPNVEHLNNYDLCRLQFKSEINESEKIHNDFLKIINKELPIIIDMMSRFEGSQSFSNNDKVTYIYKQAFYWLNYLKFKKINCYLQFDTPHDAYDYIIYLACKYLQIKLVILQQSSFYINTKNLENDFIRVITPTNDLDTGQNIFKEGHEIFLKAFDYSKIKSAYQLDAINTAFSKRESITKNENINFFKKIFNLINKETLKNNYIIDNFDKINQRLNLLKFKLLRNKIHKKTSALKSFLSKKTISLNDIDYKFLYFPLQYQPERTSCPEGRDYFNQYLAIYKLRTFLDPKIAILVKEHPKQLQKETVRNQMHRSIFFYNEIAKLKNVKFIDLSISSSKILLNRNIEGAVSIKGNIILEAFMNNIPSFYFGITIWRGLEHVHDLINDKNLFNINNLLKSNIYYDNKKSEESFFNCLKDSFISNTSIHNEYNSRDQNLFNEYISKLFESENNHG